MTKDSEFCSICFLFMLSTIIYFIFLGCYLTFVSREYNVFYENENNYILYIQNLDKFMGIIICITGSMFLFIVTIFV